MSIDMKAKRSYLQKRLESNATFNLLWMEAGDMNMYLEDETVYIDVPMLEDIAYAFPTGIDLFMKMPDFTSDINRQWFHDNGANIVAFVNEVEMVELEEPLIDENGTKSTGYEITIPKGSGYFIWDLLGMEYPDYDVKITMYITDKNRMSRMELDLEHELPGAKLIFDTEAVGTLRMLYDLPDNEYMKLTLIRNAEHTNWMDADMEYITNQGECYSLSSVVTWQKKEEGFTVDITDMNLSCEDEILAQGYFEGLIKPVQDLPTIFAGKENYLRGLPAIEWRTIRQDTDGFVEDVLDKLASQVGLLKVIRDSSKE